MSHTLTSKVYVVADNIDTDQIIPAQYLTLVPTIAEEYEKLGGYALIGLPDDRYPQRFVPEGGTKTPYARISVGLEHSAAREARSNWSRSPAYSRTR